MASQETAKPAIADTVNGLQFDRQSGSIELKNNSKPGTTQEPTTIIGIPVKIVALIELSVPASWSGKQSAAAITGNFLKAADAINSSIAIADYKGIVQKMRGMPSELILCCPERIYARCRAFEAGGRQYERSAD